MVTNWPMPVGVSALVSSNRQPNSSAEPLLLIDLTERLYPTILTLMGVPATTAKTYRYRFKVDGRVVHHGITTDLQRR